LLVSACGSTGEERASAAWGDEAMTFFLGLSRAYAEEDFLGVLDFYAPGAEVQMSRGGFTGGEVVDLLHIGPILNQELFDLHLGVEEALRLIWWPESGKYGAVEAVLDGGSILNETVFDDAVSLGRGLRATPEVLGFYNDLYAGYAEAWSSGDRNRVAAFYAPEATLSEPLFGNVSVGSEAVADLVLDSQARWTPLSIASIAGDATDVERGSALYLGPTMYGRDPQLAVGIYRVQAAGGCSIQVAVRWVLENGVIVDERHYPEVESLRRCGAGELPEGWWTNLDLPGPRDEVVTGTIHTAGNEIAVHNGTERLVGVIEWALERFDSAGLAEPRIESVTFEPSRRCAGLSGRVVEETGSRDLFLCLYERDLCFGGGTCDVPALNARVGILHELGHAWTLDHTDGPTRNRLLDLSGRETWDDPGAPWHLRGSEYAAEVLAWGLLDELVPMVRIGDPPCSELTEAFELLTGSKPVADRSDCLS
jgi:hypothetical protein